MKLIKFRVTNFRSVEDSGWIDADDVTVLIGTNESGKTNIILPLWKLNPAKEGAIVPTSDYPRKLYNQFRNQDPKPIFIDALFNIEDDLAVELSLKTGMSIDVMHEVVVSRRLDGKYEVDFPSATPPRSIQKERMVALLDNAEIEITSTSTLKSEEDLKQLLIMSIQAAKKSVLSVEEVDSDQINLIKTILSSVKTDNAPKSGEIAPRFAQVYDQIESLSDEISKPHPRDVKEAIELVINNLPKFVYYSTYGNLDSEIYLPHVIANLKRVDLGIREEAKARTLKVLFEFVRLLPQEILELGRDFKETNRQPNDQEIAAITEKKKQRSILLQSASTMLTKEFRDWWKQGEYRFRFEADGDHFRIWVSDDKRPEEIELEGRSTGLQWFLSFYLVFLVERADAHEDAILLLDEPGLSLHPLAQQDLSQFFDSLAIDNQIIYTCHSPFLVEADRLDRARKVYVDADGTSKVTSDLRATGGDIAQRGAAYAVHAALGLSVAESLLLGCEPVVVEGPSDQHYLTAIKILLTASGRLKAERELVFPPAGGAKGVKVVASILGSRDDELPVALFDSDTQGNLTAKALRNGLYAGDPKLVLQVESFTDMPNSEIEDLIPLQLIVQQLDKWQRASDVQFAEKVQEGKPVVPQIEAWAVANNVELTSPGWKVELAKKVKQRMLADGPDAIPPETLDKWATLFEAFQRRRDV